MLILSQVLHLGSENPVSREWLAFRLLSVCVSVLTNLCQRKEHFMVLDVVYLTEVVTLFPNQNVF